MNRETTIAAQESRSPRRPQTLRRRALFAAIVFIASLACAEAALRAAGYRYLGVGWRLARIVVADMDVICRLAPGDHVLDGTKIHINRWGYRGAEWAETKARGVVRIACVGDSATFGYGSPDDETYPAQLERLLAERGIPAETLNLGVIAYSSTGNLLDYQRLGARFDPDILVLLLGNWNDFHPGVSRPDQTDREMVAQAKAEGRLPAAPGEMPFYACLRIGQLAFAGVERARGAWGGWKMRRLSEAGYFAVDRPEFVRRTPLKEFGENIEAFIGLARERGAKVVFLAPQILPESAAEKPISRLYADRVRQVEAAADVKVVDLARVFADQKPDEIWLDFCHYRPTGNRLIAEALAEALAPWFEAPSNE